MSLIATKLVQLKEDVSSENLSTPAFFRLNKKDDSDRLKLLLESNLALRVFDELDGQLGELIKCRNPKRKYTQVELKEAIKEHYGTKDPSEYGVWVFYPWSNNLVHLLDAEEFIEIRTSRNKYKITPEEQSFLASKKIGVIGLSVGQSVSLSLAMERICGELVLADFDVLEISNLNRIRTGVHNLELPKPYVVAREIAEIDPFLKVTCFTEGVTSENIHDFFCAGGKLDLVIDECDGLDIKILCRQKAKEYGVPLLQEMSDRGMVDIERFDLEPSRSIMHGFIDHLDMDLSKIKTLTNEQKIPYLLPMIGPETISNRLRASMLEVEQTITTWPQLGSDVAFGGGLAASIARRILLKEFSDSGRYFFDIDHVLYKNLEGSSNAELMVPKPTSTKLNETIQNWLKQVSSKAPHPDSEILNKEVLEKLIHAANLAPSGGNCQPWKWVYKNNALYLFWDNSRTNLALDFKGITSQIALGAATENLILAAQDLGFNVSLKKYSDPAFPELIAQFLFFIGIHSDVEILPKLDFTEDLALQIPKRETNRMLGERKPISDEKLALLKAVATTTSGAHLNIMSESAWVDAIGELVAKGDRILYTTKETHNAIMNEVRWTPEEAVRTKTGVDLETLDLTLSEKVGFEIAKKWEAISLLSEWEKGEVFEKSGKNLSKSASAFGLLTMPTFDSSSFFEGGRTLERIWLMATKLGIAMHPQSPILFLFNRMRYDDALKNSATGGQLIELRKKFVELLEIDETRTDIFLFRLSITNPPKTRSQRLPLHETLVF